MNSDLIKINTLKVFKFRERYVTEFNQDAYPAAARRVR